AMDGLVRNRMIDAACRLLDTCDAVLVSDYENGVISPEVIDAVLPECARRHLTVTVDSHGDLFRFRGVTTATPNQPEAELTLGRTFETVSDLEAAGWELLAGMDAQGVLITRGSEGASLFERGAEPYHMPISIAPGSAVDVSGAGDTVAAVFTLAVAGGTSMRTAAYLGNIAGGEVVRRLGTATLSRDDLAAAIGRTQLPVPV
ncbi:MAG TPA: PfkB family carbohydrate kinase, partial [Chloroflexota bacterium]|nr:PfkB family carbohydrate kinase [Chloroflexota bacterium]